MATPAFSTSAQSRAANFSQVSVPISQTGSNLITIVCVNYLTGVPGGTVTGNMGSSLPFTLLHRETGAGNAVNRDIYYRLGALTSVELNGHVTGNTIQCVVYSGVSQTTPIVTSSNAFLTAGSTISIDTTGTINGELIVDVLAVTGGNQGSFGTIPVKFTGQTERLNQSYPSGYVGTANSDKPTTGGTVNTGWTVSQTSGTLHATYTAIRLSPATVNTPKTVNPTALLAQTTTLVSSYTKNYTVNPTALLAQTVTLVITTQYNKAFNNTLTAPDTYFLAQHIIALQNTAYTVSPPDLLAQTSTLESSVTALYTIAPPDLLAQTSTLTYLSARELVFSPVLAAMTSTLTRIAYLTLPSFDVALAPPTSILLTNKLGPASPNGVLLVTKKAVPTAVLHTRRPRGGVTSL